MARAAIVVGVSDVATAVKPAPLRPVHVRATSLLAAAAALAVILLTGLSLWDVAAALTAAALVWVAAIDVETRLLPNRIVVPATVVVLGAALTLGTEAFLEHALCALAGGGFLFAAAAARPRDLGMGDAKLALLLGALLGTAVLQALLIGFCLVAAAGVVLVAAEGRQGLKRHLPLGPFLAAGALATLLLTGAS
jgi:leader peptidase (prepilin peptidase)/N-methyltransferase